MNLPFRCQNLRSIDLSYQPFLQRSQLRGESSDFQAAQRAAKTARALREPRGIGGIGLGVDHEKMGVDHGKNGGFMRFLSGYMMLNDVK